VDLSWEEAALFVCPHCGASFGTQEELDAHIASEHAPIVSTDAATNILQEQATPNGTLVDDRGEACDCGFEWGETIAYGNTTPTQSRTTGQSFSQTITGLDPNTTYHFRAFATNSAGTSYGVDRRFITPPILSRAHALSREEL